MAANITVTFALLDAPYETARTTTALRLMDIAARRGYNINVFAYEGAVYVPFAHQQAHPNAVHGHDVEEEDHPLPREWVSAIMAETEKNGGTYDLVHFWLCLAEHGAVHPVAGGPPARPGATWTARRRPDTRVERSARGGRR